MTTLHLQRNPRSYELFMNHFKIFWFVSTDCFTANQITVYLCLCNMIHICVLVLVNGWYRPRIALKLRLIFKGTLLVFFAVYLHLWKKRVKLGYFVLMFWIIHKNHVSYKQKFHKFILTIGQQFTSELNLKCIPLYANIKCMCFIYLNQ